MKCYKVVSRHNTLFKSAVIGFQMPTSCDYQIGETTEPPVGALFAFKHLKDARAFCNQLNTQAVWSSWTVLEGHGPRSRRKYPRGESGGDWWDLEAMAASWRGPRRVCKADWPRGTVLVTSFTAEKEVV